MVDFVEASQPRDVLFQLFDLRPQVAAVLEMLFLRTAFRLKTVVLAPQRRRLLFERRVLGLERG